MDLDAPVALTLECLVEHLRRPARETPFDDLPARLERHHELVRAARCRFVILPAQTTQRIGERCGLRARFLGHATEPVDAGARGMSGDGPDRPLAGRGSPPELLARERPQGFDQTRLALSPPAVDEIDADAFLDHATSVRALLRPCRPDAPSSRARRSPSRSTGRCSTRDARACRTRGRLA